MPSRRRCKLGSAAPSLLCSLNHPSQLAHTFITLYCTPSEVRWHIFSRWAVLFWGNIAGTLMPTFARRVSGLDEKPPSDD